ncbi:BQ2448_2306 [Microbotryum intermedium]|uniref:BQ2448_2306 protein n=1 Tax=Microbotryum intermedium TaxID=269621 RepID=A0A238FDW0_9BASI|nr:BQ2448_2306 [Microbotryum intermedium]
MRRQMSPIEPLQGPNRKNDVVVGDSEEEGENALSDGSINVPSRPNCIQSKLRDSGSVRSETIASTHDLLNSSPAHRSRTRSTFGSSSIGRITNREFTENGFVLEVTAQPSKIASKRAKSAPVRRATSSKRARAAPEPVDSEMEHHGSDFFVDEADLRSLLTSSVSGTTIQRAVDTDMPIGSGKPCPALVGKTTPGEPDSQDLRKRKKRFDNEFSGSLAKAGSRKAIEHGPSTRTSSPMELLPISSPPAERSPSCKSPQHGPRNALHVQSEPIAEKRENPVRGLAGILTRKGIAGVRHPGLSKAAKVPRLHINLKPPPPPKSSIPKPKEKKKGDESYSDEEKPWWKTKHPEEWTDEDFERYRRITERRERGLDSD